MTESRLGDIPLKACFSFSFPIRRLPEIPELTAEPVTWPDRYILPATSSLDGVEPFAQVYAGWHEDGIWVAFRVDQGIPPLPRPERFWTGDACEVWIDTRDSRRAHKPTRYCHHLYLLPEGKRVQSPTVGWVRMGQTPKGEEPDLLRVRIAGGATDRGYALEAFFPAEVLYGYDPVESPVIGFCYNICSVAKGRMHFSLSEGFRVHEDPSMWASCRLVDE